MLIFAVEYRKPIDDITAEKSSPLRKYELSLEEWTIVEDLVFVLQARFLSVLKYSRPKNCPHVWVPLKDWPISPLEAMIT